MTPILDRAAFIRANTRLLPVPQVPEIRLHLADDATELWAKTEADLGQLNLPPPFWAFAWAGGQALGRYVLDNAGEMRRARVLEADGPIDWAHAESLAFASLLVDGTPIRMTGQDTQRGTFSQRHLVLHDVNTGARYCPLANLREARAGFGDRRVVPVRGGAAGGPLGQGLFQRHGHRARRQPRGGGVEVGDLGCEQRLRLGQRDAGCDAVGGTHAPSVCGTLSKSPMNVSSWKSKPDL